MPFIECLYDLNIIWKLHKSHFRTFIFIFVLGDDTRTQLADCNYSECIIIYKIAYMIDKLLEKP